MFSSLDADITHVVCERLYPFVYGLKAETFQNTPIPWIPTVAGGTDTNANQ